MSAVHDFVATRMIRPTFEWGRGHTRSGRRAYHAYKEGLRLRRRSEVWSELERESWVLERLRETLRYAYATTAYYRALFDQIGFDPRNEVSWSDFARLPPLTRSEVQDNAGRLRSSAISPYEARAIRTGGSTGQPVEIWTGPAERGWRASGAEYSMTRLGVGEGVRRAMLWGHHLDPVTRDGLGERISDFLSNRRWYDCLRLSPERLGQFDRDLRRYRPQCILAYASALAELASFLESGNRPPPNYPRRCLVTGAEKLYEPQRERIERVFGRPVHERYGSRDVGDMGFQRLEHGSRHFDVDWALVLVEPITDEAEAPIAVTKLHGDGMPMIRYLVDDVAVFPTGSRPGHPVWRLEAILGRQTDRILLPGGGRVHGLSFPHLLKDYPVRDFQVHQTRDYAVTLRLVPTGQFTSAHRSALEANLLANLRGVSCAVELVDHIPRTQASKWRPVISDVSDRT
jgi:phenylacetate-CoA ligase